MELINANEAHIESLNPIEIFCRNISNIIGSPFALILSIIVQVTWIAIGIITKLDPWPFAFLLTCSNVIQLILIFVLAVAQKQSSEHAETRAEIDHQNITKLMEYQKMQEDLLRQILDKLK